MKKLINITLLLFAGFLIASCGSGPEKAEGDSADAPTSMIEDEPAEVDPMESKGIGPISSLELSDEIDTDLAAAGEEVFTAKCSACHKTDKKFVGPNPTGVLERRSPEWVMNMILNPEEMTQTDPIAKALLVEYNGAPMANQNLTEDEARSVLEYFRTL
ncbi:MAG: c-type cytochrome [Bacteroidia bacterium]